MCYIERVIMTLIERVRAEGSVSLGKMYSDAALDIKNDLPQGFVAEMTQCEGLEWDEYVYLTVRKMTGREIGDAISDGTYCVMTAMLEQHLEREEEALRRMWS
tara:strand:+ start:384 stop:692 length:309 start_codon:yes stop_codon:yes gene_type:complete